MAAAQCSACTPTHQPSPPTALPAAPRSVVFPHSFPESQKNETGRVSLIACPLQYLFHCAFEADNETMNQVTFGSRTCPQRHQVTPSSPHPHGAAQGAAGAICPSLTSTITCPGPFLYGSRGPCLPDRNRRTEKCCHHTSQSTQRFKWGEQKLRHNSETGHRVTNLVVLSRKAQSKANLREP